MTASGIGSQRSQAIAAQGGGINRPEPASRLSARAFAVGLPDTEAAAEALIGNAQVASDFDLGGESDVFGLVELGTNVPEDATGIDIVLSTEALFTVSTSRLEDPQNLLIGLLDPVFDGSTSGLSAEFEILIDGESQLSETLTSAAEASATLDDRTIDLGSILSPELGSAGKIDLLFRLTVTSSIPGAGFGLNLIFGNSTIGSGPAVPEPGTATLLGLGLLILGARRAGCVRDC
ncbi:MAG: PEP-CTERM sorting domain-containing protein [Myxococcota bacterium]